MAQQEGASTGGMLVILGIIVAVALGFFIFRSGAFNSGTHADVHISAPDMKADITK